jgi:hypothetical protein
MDASSAAGLQMAGKPTPTRNRESGAVEHGVDDVLPQADGGRVARASRIWKVEELQHGDDRGLERGDAVDPFAEVEGEIELAAPHALHPAAVGVDGDANDLIPLGDEHALDRLDRLEDQDIRARAQGRCAVEEQDDFHETPHSW